MEIHFNISSWWTREVLTPLPVRMSFEFMEKCIPRYFYLGLSMFKCVHLLNWNGMKTRYLEDIPIKHLVKLYSRHMDYVLYCSYFLKFKFVGKHDDIIKWKRFPRYWPFVQGIHQSPVNSPCKGQWCRALMFSLICAWLNGWVNNREAGDLRCHHAHYDIIVMYTLTGASDLSVID